MNYAINYAIDYSTLRAVDSTRLRSFAEVALSTVQGVQHTFLLAEQVLQRGVLGCFVECGVAAGANAAAMALALQQYKVQRELYLCDSFEGIPLAGPKDPEQPGIRYFLKDPGAPLDQRLVSSGVSACSVAGVKANFERWALGDVQTRYIQGWFQHTLYHLRAYCGPIAMLRLDTDLYESHITCLQQLYDLVSPGGVILQDDYPFPHSGPRVALKEFFNGQEPDITVNVDTGAGYWVKA